MHFRDELVVPHVIIAFLDGLGKRAAQHIVDEQVDVGDIQFAVIVDVSPFGHIVVGWCAEYDVNEVIDVGNVDLAVPIHIAHL